MAKLVTLADTAALAVSAADRPALAGSREDANVQVIKDFYAAYATENPEAVRPFLPPNVVWKIPGHHPLAGEKLWSLRGHRLLPRPREGQVQG